MFKSLSYLHRAWIRSVLSLTCVLMPLGSSFADEITIPGKGKDEVHSGSVKYENDDLVILETETGAWLRLVKKEIKDRVAKPAPPFVPPEQLAEKLLGLKADDPLVRFKVAPDCIAVLILETPIAKENEKRADEVLAKMVKTYDLAAKGVAVFAKKQKLVHKKPAFPAVVRMFESEVAADDASSTDQSLMEKGVAGLYDSGWYDPISNVASISMVGLLGYEGTMTHVLVRQQLFHTGILKREAPIPYWFLAGFSAGFETTNTKIEANHLKLSPETFEGLQEPTPIDWDRMVSDYDYYMSEGDMAYYDLRDQGWGLHWYLINKNKIAYARYWKTLTEMTPLDEYDTEKSLEEFKKAFGKTPKSFKPLFEKAFETAARTSPPKMGPEEPIWIEKSEFGIAGLDWLDAGLNPTEIRMEGSLTNASPLRARSFCVGFTTTKGKYATWFIDNLEPLKTVKLRSLQANEPEADKNPKKDKAEEKAVKKPAPEGEHIPDVLWIKSVPSDGPEAEKWRKGELPPPPM